MSVRARRASSQRWARRDDRGAAAVEFALLSIPLFTILFGAINYGLYFADVQTVQSSTADVARDATLSVSSSGLNWTGTTGCVSNPSTASELAKVVCDLNTTVKPLGGGEVYGKAEIVDGTGAVQTAWSPGNRLRLCAVTKYQTILPFVPMPGGGLITARVEMPIQDSGLQPLPTLPSAEMDVSSIGTDWAWC